MKLTKFHPKNLFKIKKTLKSSSSSSVSRSDPQSGSSSSSLDGSIHNNNNNLNNNNKASSSSGTPTSVLPSNSPFLLLDSKSSGEWSEEINIELIEAFKLIDKDGDGKITQSELSTLLRRVGAEPPNDEELMIMFKEVDSNGDGCISLEEFSAISCAFEPPTCGSELRDAFDFFDADRDGKISAEELRGVFMAIGDDRCTLDECRRMITGVDSDGDGFVCFEDFSRMMERQR